jgi:two-component system LytT family response regulator
MIRTFIMDDEPRNLKLVEMMITSHCPSLKIVGMTDDLSEGLPMIELLKPSLLLLDIEFPHGNVFHLLEKLLFRDFHIIFITAHNSYASEAFRHHAVDYILKPITKEALIEAVKNVEERMQLHSIQDVTKLVEALKSQFEYSGKIPLPSAEGILFVDENNINHCEGSGRYTVIYLDGGKKLTIAKTLKEIEALLNPLLFFRVHHSHIINLKKINRYHRGHGGTLELSDGSIVNVSSSRKDELLNILMNRTGNWLH